MKTALIALIALSILTLGCIGSAPQTPGDNTPPGDTGTTPPSDDGTTFTAGTFDLIIQQCYGTKLRILNNGTGTAYLDSAIKVESTGGTATYGTISGNTTLQPAETKTVDITKDLNTLNETYFSLYKYVEEADGNVHYRFQFTC